MSLPKLASRLAEKWALHLEFLHASLEHEPSGPQAWRWQIKARVLTYLVARYGNDPKIGLARPQSRPDYTAVPPPRRHFIAPRPGHAFTERLQRIAEANDVPPEEQSHLAEDLNRRSPQSPLSPSDELRFTKFAMYLWLLLAVAAGAFVAMLWVTGGQSLAFSLAAGILVWVVVTALWFMRS